MTGHPVRLGADSRLVIVRQAPPEDPERLRFVARRLGAAAGAGAVDLVHVLDDGQRVELALAFAGRPLSAPVGAHALVPIATALAAHLSDLHLRGLVHGAVVGEHVLVDASGAVRLCGFGHADDVAPSADVHAFGLLLRTLLDPHDRSSAADALRLHADRCGADESARPSMAAIAASLSGIDGRDRSTRVSTRPSMWRRTRVATVAVALVAALGLVALPRVSRAELQRDVASPTTVATTTPSTTSTTAGAMRVWPRSLEHDGAAWTLGDTDDRTAVADADCDGVRTPVVLQLPEGHVWFVDGWRDGAPATFVTTIDGARDIAALSSEGCDVVIVRTADGEIRLTPSA